MGLPLFSWPSATHIDAWTVVLGLAAIAAVGAGLCGRHRRRSLWRHHHYRAEVEPHYTAAAAASGALVAIAAVAHADAWAVWGVPLLGAVGLTLAVATLITWRWIYLPQLRAYEQRDSNIATPRARLPAVKPRVSELPLLGVVGGGLAAYALFLAHSWNHVFHMGMWILGGLGGFVIASLVAAQTADIVRLQRHMVRRARR